MKKFKAFTLVETLIVIVVFCIGILTVLFWLSQTLRNKDYAEIQIQSAFFAREWIEMIFNLRDANYHKKLPWNCIFKYNSTPIQIEVDEERNEQNNPACNWYFWSGDENKIFKVWMWTGDNYIYIEKWNLDEDFDSIFSGFQINSIKANRPGNRAVLLCFFLVHPPGFPWGKLSAQLTNEGLADDWYFAVRLLVCWLSGITPIIYTQNFNATPHNSGA